jgi:hypothetical protein
MEPRTFIGIGVGILLVWAALIALLSRIIGSG